MRPPFKVDICRDDLRANIGKKYGPEQSSQASVTNFFLSHSLHIKE